MNQNRDQIRASKTILRQKTRKKIQFKIGEKALIREAEREVRQWKHFVIFCSFDKIF